MQHSNRLKAIFNWLRPTKEVIVGLSILIASIIFACVLECPFGFEREAQIRYAGMFLELCGLALVASGIRATRQQFGEPAVRESLKRWILRNPLRTHPVPRARLSGLHLAVTGQPPLDPDLPLSVGPEPSLEDRIRALEVNLQHVNARLTQTERTSKEAIASLHRISNEERDKRLAADEQIYMVLRNLSVDGLKFETVGVVWLFIGIIFSSASSELSRWCP